MDQIIDAIERHGPLTSEQMRQHIDLGKSSISSQTQTLRAKRQVYIIGYKANPNGSQGRNAPIYALGNKTDAKDIPKREMASKKTEKVEPSVKRSCNFDQRYPGVRQSAGMWAGLML